MSPPPLSFPVIRDPDGSYRVDVYRGRPRSVFGPRLDARWDEVRIVLLLVVLVFLGVATGVWMTAEYHPKLERVHSTGAVPFLMGILIPLYGGAAATSLFRIVSEAQVRKQMIRDFEAVKEDLVLLQDGQLDVYRGVQAKGHLSNP